MGPADAGRRVGPLRRTGSSSAQATIDLADESGMPAFDGRTVRRRLHVSACGRFAAVVHDYGRSGVVVDLHRGDATLRIDGGDYLHDTVPFSFAFARVDGRTLAIHRSGWNRLDLSDPESGALLTPRGPTERASIDDRPEHYLDYFHGALHVSPEQRQVVDLGWIWHPIGLPCVWSLAPWAGGNVWESEDGASRQEVCVIENRWDRAAVWIDEHTLVLGGCEQGVGEATALVDGVTVHDLTLRCAREDWIGDYARVAIAFEGPRGSLFVDGGALFAADDDGLSRWDLRTGSCTGRVPGFIPTRQHRRVRELVQVAGGTLRRWWAAPDAVRDR